MGLSLTWLTTLLVIVEIASTESPPASLTVESQSSESYCATEDTDQCAMAENEAKQIHPTTGQEVEGTVAGEPMETDHKSDVEMMSQESDEEDMVETTGPSETEGTEGNGDIMEGIGQSPGVKEGDEESTAAKGAAGMEGSATDELVEGYDVIQVEEAAKENGVEHPIAAADGNDVTQPTAAEEPVEGKGKGVLQPTGAEEPEKGVVQSKASEETGEASVEATGAEEPEKGVVQSIAPEEMGEGSVEPTGGEPTGTVLQARTERQDRQGGEQGGEPTEASGVHTGEKLLTLTVMGEGGSAETGEGGAGQATDSEREGGAAENPTGSGENVMENMIPDITQEANDLNTLETVTQLLSSTEEEEEEEAIPEFPKTLEGFKYRFNEEGELRHTETDYPFEFVVKEGNKRYNQRHYEALGEVITEEVYKLLETRGKLTKHYLPVDATDDEPCSFFFMSDGAMENPDKLLVLIHGSGVVRAGQWARSLIINHNVNSGTQLPYIERGMEEGYGVMVLNTNLNYDEKEGRRNIRDNSTPQEHAYHVWKHFIGPSKAKRIDIVAHSFGGVVTVDLMCGLQEFRQRVHKIAFTDSVHSLYSHRVTRGMKKWIMANSRNWVSSPDDLDEPQDYYFEPDVPRVSAGTTKHVETSWRAFDSVFKFFAKDNKEQ